MATSSPALPRRRTAVVVRRSRTGRRGHGRDQPRRRKLARHQPRRGEERFRAAPGSRRRAGGARRALRRGAAASAPALHAGAALPRLRRGKGASCETTRRYDRRGVRVARHATAAARRGTRPRRHFALRLVPVALLRRIVPPSPSLPSSFPHSARASRKSVPYRSAQDARCPVWSGSSRVFGRRRASAQQCPNRPCKERSRDRPRDNGLVQPDDVRRERRSEEPLAVRRSGTSRGPRRRRSPRPPRGRACANGRGVVFGGDVAELVGRPATDALGGDLGRRVDHPRARLSHLGDHEPRGCGTRRPPTAAASSSATRRRSNETSPVGRAWDCGRRGTPPRRCRRRTTPRASAPSPGTPAPPPSRPRGAGRERDRRRTLRSAWASTSVSPSASRGRRAGSGRRRGRSRA